MAGGGVRTSAAGRNLVALAERLAIPVATSLNGKDSIPGTHPLSVGVVGTYSRESANRLVGEADVVCFVGTQTGSMTTHFWRVPPVGVSAIQIDIDAEGLGRNYPLEVAIVSDAKVALERMLSLCDAATAAAARPGWRERPPSDRAGTRSISPSWPRSPCPSGLNASAPNSANSCRADGIVMVDTGHAGMWMGGMYDLSDSAQDYIRSAGHLGWAFPAGLGAKCGVPDRPVVTFTGDAGIWYHIAELETAVRWRINAITVVNNNSSGNQSRAGFDRVYGGQRGQRGRELWTFSDVSFAAIAESVGALGIRVDKPRQFAPAFLQALEARRPVVIDVATDIDALAPGAVL